MSQGRGLRVKDVAAYLRVSHQRGTQMYAERWLPEPERTDSTTRHSILCLLPAETRAAAGKTLTVCRDLDHPSPKGVDRRWPPARSVRDRPPVADCHD